MIDYWGRILELERRLLRLNMSRFDFEQKQKQAQDRVNIISSGSFARSLSQLAIGFNGWSDNLEFRLANVTLSNGYIYNSAVTTPTQGVSEVAGPNTYYLTYPPTNPYGLYTLASSDQSWLFDWTVIPVIGSTSNTKNWRYSATNSTTGALRFCEIYATINAFGQAQITIKQSVSAGGTTSNPIIQEHSFVVSANDNLPFNGTTGLRSDTGLNNITGGDLYYSTTHTIYSLSGAIATGQLRWS